MEAISIHQQQTMIVVSQSEWLQTKQQIDNICNKLDKLNFDTVLQPKEYISVKEVLQSFSMCRSQFEELRKLGIIKTYKVKGKIYVKTAEIKEVFKNAKQ